jgi:geranylgeranyl diphosphate synthase type II
LSLEESLRQQIDTALQRYALFTKDCPARLSTAIRYSLLAPGKRLRPQLVLFACRACGGQAGAALPAAVAVEMIHAYSLVHDDLPAMDDDDLRRGQPTCHKQYDEATAVLVGDALQARAFEILATEIKPATRAAQCCAELARAAGAEAMVGGQVADLAAESKHVSASQLEAIHRRKTGALFCVSLRLGAIVANASSQAIACLDEYGRHLGLAFQIVDDLLDVEGLLDVVAPASMGTSDPAPDIASAPPTQDQHQVNKRLATGGLQLAPHNSLIQAEHHVGKRLGKDQQRGKATYPSLLGIEASRHQVQALVSQACQAIEPLGKAAEPLGKLANYVRQRSR